MKFKVGDRVVVTSCPRKGSELGWTGVVVKHRSLTSETGYVHVLIHTPEQHSQPISYKETQLTLISKLSKILE